MDQIEDSVIKLCECGCDSCSSSGRDVDDVSRAWYRTVKRKLDERDDEDVVFVGEGSDVARVDIGNECEVLREMVTSQQETIQDLSIELDEERNAAASAANEAMSMILRLQSEKAEVQMEARQFKRFSEERMAHDQQEIMALEDCLYKREQTIEALTCEVHAYKHRMLSYGVTESEADGENENNDLMWDNELVNEYDYPPLKCNLIENRDVEHDNETVDIEQYAYVESPPSLRDIEERINEMENSPEHSPVHVQEKVVIARSDSVSECGDDTSDRIYTVDSIHTAASFDNDIKVNIARNESSDRIDIGDIEVTKLYARLHALEADRESMRQTLVSMRTDKAQLVLLKEIAQHLSKDISPPRRMPVKKGSLFGSFSFFMLFKWIGSYLLWRRRARRSKYMFGMSASNAGLRMLVNKGPQMGQWRCLSRTQFLKY